MARKTIDDLRYEMTMRAVDESKRKKTAPELRGEATALAGIGITDHDELLRVLTEQCGPYALMDRSDWLIGHKNALYVMEQRATEAATAAFVQALRSLGAEVTARGKVLDVVGLGIGLRLEVDSPIVPKPVASKESL